MPGKYTIPVCEIIEEIWREGHENEEESTPSFENIISDINEKVDYSRPYIFQGTYPYYGDADDKKRLEMHILKSYYTREINQDSVARWILFLMEKLDDIMPKYVQMYNAQAKLIASDILNPYHIEETKDGKIDTSKNRVSKTSSELSNESESDTISTSSGKDNTQIDNTNKFSNTPQALAQTGQDYLTSMTLDNTTNANTFENNSDNSNTAKSKSIDSTNIEDNDNELKAEDYTKIIKGNIGKMNYAELIKAYQDVIMNIEEMITKELSDLFFNIY